MACAHLCVELDTYTYIFMHCLILPKKVREFISMLQATALDKASRFFEGRKQQLTLPDGEKDDEIF